MLLFCCACTCAFDECRNRNAKPPHLVRVTGLVSAKPSERSNFAKVAERYIVSVDPVTGLWADEPKSGNGKGSRFLLPFRCNIRANVRPNGLSDWT